MAAAGHASTASPSASATSPPSTASSLDIYEREFFALLGPSGLRQDHAVAHARGLRDSRTPAASCSTAQDLAGVPPYRRPVNMMFQSYALFPHLTVARQRRLRAQAGRPAEGRDRRARRRDAGAGAARPASARRKPRPAFRRPAPARRARARAGQAAEGAAARRAARGARQKLREETQFELMELQRALGLTFVIVTHDQDEAMTVADRIARDGPAARSSQVGDAGRDLRAAEFALGRGLHRRRQPDRRRASPRSIRRRRRVEARRAARCASRTAPSSRRAPVWVALRPEKIRIAARAPPDGARERRRRRGLRHRLSRRLSIYKVRLDGGLVLKAAVANGSAPSRAPIARERPRSGCPGRPKPAWC